MEYSKTSIGITQEKLDHFYAELEAPEWKKNRMRSHLQQLQREYNGQCISGEELRRWRQMLLEKGLSPRTVESYVTSVNAFLRWAGVSELCFRPGKAADLAGRRFGRLTAVEPVPHWNPKSRSIVWRCRCDCGREVKAPAAQLLNGVYQSCGCLRTERLLESNGYVENTCLRMVLSDRIRRDNTSGCRGVFQKRDKWSARIQYKGRIYSLGTYSRIEDAIKARKSAEAWVKDDAERLRSSMMGTEKQMI